MAAVSYSDNYSVQLVPRLIPCLGCFLYGFGYENVRKVVNSAILNEQWKLNFYKCKEDGFLRKGPKHFNIDEQEKGQFTLIGCNETLGPVWAEQRWDKDGKWFKPTQALPSPMVSYDCRFKKFGPKPLAASSQNLDLT